MKAVLLVGGQGTRLRPLTSNRPKPLLPVANKPHLDHVLSLLKAHGFSEAVLAVQYMAEEFDKHYAGQFEGMKITVVPEPEARGTAGAVKNVADHLTPGETFLVFNGDILTDLDLSAMIAFHQSCGSVCTIALTPVEDPSMYGVVDLDDERRIQRFTEKPRREEATSNLINAGTYILEYEVLDAIPAGQHYMFERGLFPGLLAAGKPLYGYPSDSYWLDIGTPQKYLQAQHDLLLGRMHMQAQPNDDHHWLGREVEIDPHAVLHGPIMLGDGCVISGGATLVGPLVLGPGCRVARGAYLEGALLWEQSSIGEQSRVINSVVGANAQVMPNVQISEGAIVADECVIEESNQLAGGIKLWPGLRLPKGSVSF